jgi:hypothetical protein
VEPNQQQTPKTNQIKPVTLHQAWQAALAVRNGWPADAAVDDSSPYCTYQYRAALQISMAGVCLRCIGRLKRGAATRLLSTSCTDLGLIQLLLHGAMPLVFLWLPSTPLPPLCGQYLLQV